jgi:hypothetical protein
VTVDVAGLPDEEVELFRAAAAGDNGAATRLVARGWLPGLVEEGRIDPTTEAIEAAVGGAELIRQHVDTTLAITAEPAGACSAR